MNADVKRRDMAVLIACHNRREITLRGLRRLFQQQLPADCAVRVILVDDGSSDGTGDAVRSEFPQVNVIRGDGSYFCFHSLYTAWNVARPADFYIWLNDDVDLEPNAFARLLETYDASGNPASIVVGGTCDPETGATCTGGLRRPSWHHNEVITPTDQPQMCDTFDGNIVLVPREAEEKIGMMDARYTHMFGDCDYGLRARKAGLPVLLSPGYLGTTKLNSLKGGVYDLRTSFRDRWNQLLGPKGHRKPNEWWAFVRAHAPRPKIIYWFVPYVACIVEGLSGNRIQLRRNILRPVQRSFD